MQGCGAPGLGEAGVRGGSSSVLGTKGADGTRAHVNITPRPPREDKPRKRTREQCLLY